MTAELSIAKPPTTNNAKRTNRIMSDTSNIESIEHLLSMLDDSIDFTRAGVEQSLGRDLIRNQATRINDRAAAEQGSRYPFAPNRGKYGKKKRELGIIVGRGIVTEDGSPDVMMSLLNAQGEQSVQATEVTMEFGATEEARNKGHWFTNGSRGEVPYRSGAKNQKPRPFYEITPSDADAMFAEVVDNVTDWLKSL